MSAPFTRKEFIVPEEKSNQRIDLFLAAMMPELSRRKVRQILDVGGCYVNNKRMHIASRQVRSGDKVRVEFSTDGLKKSRQKKFTFNDQDILYDSGQLLAVNKPPGLPSQATRDQDVMHAETCLRDWLKTHGRGREKLILLHRLDKETSGVLLFATNSETATWITDQFRQRKIKKTYWALCRGLPKPERFSKECYLSEIDKKTGKVTPVRSGGKPSRTDFYVRSFSPQCNVAWVECYPETGRSHQIRVHLEMVGTPILGDKKYGKEIKVAIPDQVMGLAANHHMLHARSLEFIPNSGASPVTIVADVPDAFAQVLKIINPPT